VQAQLGAFESVVQTLPSLHLASRSLLLSSLHRLTLAISHHCFPAYRAPRQQQQQQQQQQLCQGVVLVAACECKGPAGYRGMGSNGRHGMA
jgi:hypothetical protein